MFSLRLNSKASQLPPGYPPKYPHDPRFFPPDSVAGAAVPGAPSSYGYYPPSWPPTMYHDPYGPYGRPPVSLPPGYPPGYPPPSSYGRPPPGPGASHSHPPDGCSNLSPKEGSHPAGPGQYNGWSRPPPPPHGYSLPPIYSYDRSLAYDPYGYRPPYDPSTGQPFGGQRPPLINRRRSSGGSELKVVIPKTEGATSTTSRGFPSNSSTPLSDGRSSNPSPTELSRFYPVYAGRISGDNPNAQNVQHDSRQQSRSPNHPGGDRFQQMSANSQDGRPPTPSHENPLMRQNPYAHPYYSYPDGGAGETIALLFESI